MHRPHIVTWRLSLQRVIVITRLVCSPLISPNKIESDTKPPFYQRISPLSYFHVCSELYIYMFRINLLPSTTSYSLNRMSRTSRTPSPGFSSASGNPVELEKGSARFTTPSHTGHLLQSQWLRTKPSGEVSRCSEGRRRIQRTCTFQRILAWGEEAAL